MKAKYYYIKVFSYLLFVAALASLYIAANTNIVSAASPAPTAIGADCTTADGKPGVQTGPGCVPKDLNPGLQEKIQAQQNVKGTCQDIKQDGGIISDGWISTLCTGGVGQTAIQSIIENLTNFILNLGIFVFAIMIGLGMVQVIAGGASPEALKAGKKRILLAASSIALFFAARVFLDLIGINGAGRFLGVELTDFDQNTILELVGAVWQYIQFFGGALAITMIIVGGIRMMTAAGNPQQIQAARKIITFAVIGLLGVASASLIFNLIRTVITG